MKNKNASLIDTQCEMADLAECYGHYSLADHLLLNDLSIEETMSIINNDKYGGIFTDIVLPLFCPMRSL